MEEQSNSQMILSSAELDEVVDKVEKMPSEQREIVYQRLELFAGDLPHPAMLREYSELYPDAAKKIIDNGIAESEHRRRMEGKYLESQIKERKLGQLLGFIIALSVIFGGVYLVNSGHVLSGSVLSGVTALSLIGLFTGDKSDSDKKN